MPPLLSLLPERTVWLQHRCHTSRAAPQRRRRQRWSGAAAGADGRRSAGSGSVPCLFDTLEVHPSATRDEIKQAFRRLARQWHPDVNPSPDAADRFKAISQAFEVLSDEQQRRLYEQARFGTTSQRASSKASSSSSSSSANGGSAWHDQHLPPDVEGVLHLAFREAVLGAQRSVVVEVTDACRQCGGTGGQPGTPVPPCTMCRGRGEIVRLAGAAGSAAAAPPDHAEHAVVCCPICCGRGFRPQQRCSRCGGAGLTRQPRSVAVTAPAGVESGSLLRVAGEGSVGRPGGPRGAVALEVKVGEEEGVWRQGLDLHSQLAVPLWDALLGGTATVSTIRGATASLAVPPGTQHGAVLSIPNAGVHREGPAQGQLSRGSHHFQVAIRLPREVSSAEQELLWRLKELQEERQRQRQAG